MNAITFSLIGVLTTPIRAEIMNYEREHREFLIYELLAERYDISRPQYERALQNTYNTINFERKERGFDYGVGRLTNLLLTNLSIVPEYQIRIRIEQIFVNSLFNFQIQPRSETYSVLSHLKRENFKLGLIVNTMDSSGDAYRELVANNLALGNIFDSMTFSNEVGFSKPHPFIFGTAQTELGIENPQDIIHVGENLKNDIIGAKKANFRTIHFQNNRSTSKDINKIKPDFKIEHLSELLDKISEIPW
ncbi:HAD family hydrolase [Candidatus Hodarchaeum mangrovi]